MSPLAITKTATLAAVAASARTPNGDVIAAPTRAVSPAVVGRSASGKRESV